jgi:hypothetical protein
MPQTLPTALSSSSDQSFSAGNLPKHTHKTKRNSRQSPARPHDFVLQTAQAQRRFAEICVCVRNVYTLLLWWLAGSVGSLLVTDGTAASPYLGDDDRKPFHDSFTITNSRWLRFTNTGSGRSWLYCARRVLSLSEDGVPCQQPLPELYKLRKELIISVRG